MSRFSLATLILAGGLWLSAGAAFAGEARPAELQRAEAEYTTLQARLQTLIGEIEALKRVDRSVRDNYRLRDRQAEAEATAQQVTRVESRIRALGGPVAGDKVARAPVETPHATGEENRFEREAKADLLADQTMRLLREADRLQTAATELRARASMRRQAGRWDRDPFAGMESSKRSMPVVTSPRVTITTDSAPGTGTRGPSNSNGLTAGGSLTAPTNTGNTGTKGTTSTIGTPTTGVGTSAQVPTTAPPADTSTAGGASESASAASAATSSKATPSLIASPLSDRLDQRVFLDPATAAQIRSTLGAEAALSDPEALARAAELLRARAHALTQEERALRGRGSAPK